MITVLDFDRVLFDTDAFIERLNQEGLGEMARGQELLDAIDEKKIDWSEFVNKEAIEYLETTDDYCVILSSYHSRNRGDNGHSEDALKLFQEKKIELSGLKDFVKRVIVVGEHKKEKLNELYVEFGNEHIMSLVDDEEENISAAKELGLKTVWYRTPKNVMQPHSGEGLPQHVESEQAASFSEFLELREKWKLEK